MRRLSKTVQQLATGPSIFAQDGNIYLGHKRSMVYAVDPETGCVSTCSYTTPHIIHCFHRSFFFAFFQVCNGLLFEVMTCTIPLSNRNPNHTCTFVHTHTHTHTHTHKVRCGGGFSGPTMRRRLEAPLTVRYSSDERSTRLLCERPKLLQWHGT